jgi:hypothetical protein
VEKGAPSIFTRDDFSQSTKDTLARRVNFLCSNPDCPLATAGPHSDPEKAVSKGVAAHITAAAPGGKRYDPSLTPAQRSSANNGIWLCQNCAKLIDSDEARFTVELLRAWKVVAEAKADQSIRCNSPLSSTGSANQLRVRGSYAGGEHGSHALLNVFNAGTSPIYLSAWYAEWGDRSANISWNCVRGQLPFRLQAQDTHTLVVDLGERGFTGLKKVGLVDGSNQHFNVGETETAIMVQEAERYSVFHKKPDNSERESKLRECEVEVHAEIETAPHGVKTLIISFTNKSSIPIPLVGGRIEWEYDPPRTQPRGADATGPVFEFQQTGGSVNLACRTSLSAPVPPGSAVQFYVHPDLAGFLVETLLDDVKDKDIAITFGTTTRFGWKAQEDEIPGTIREFAQHVVHSRQSQ